jgi:transcription initiation factor IIE alpha subunit
MMYGGHDTRGALPVPVIAKLSKLFYDRFGEAVANELVELLNQVDTSSRSQLRELNEQNFARLEAKVDQRIADTRGELLGAVAKVEVRVSDRLSAFEASVRKDLHAQTRFMYFAWAVQLAAIVGLYAR